MCLLIHDYYTFLKYTNIIIYKNIYSIHWLWRGQERKVSSKKIHYNVHGNLPSN